MSDDDDEIFEPKRGVPALSKRDGTSQSPSRLRARRVYAAAQAAAVLRRRTPRRHHDVTPPRGGGCAPSLRSPWRAASAGERKALFIAFLLNAALAAGLAIAGVAADSSALIANALDNTSDALVYAISLYAATRGARWKVRAARLSGFMLLVLAAGVLVDVVRRFFGTPEPFGPLIIAMAVIAAAVNVLCLKILKSHRAGDVNLRAAWTFSVNDMLSNLGILLAGLLVMWLGRAWPDLVVGLAVAAVAAKGGLEILRDVGRVRRQAKENRD